MQSDNQIEWIVLQEFKMKDKEGHNFLELDLAKLVAAVGQPFNIVALLKVKGKNNTFKFLVGVPKDDKNKIFLSGK